MYVNDFNHPFVKKHFLMSVEGTNNHLSYIAKTSPENDKNLIFPDDKWIAMGLGEDIKTLFDYRNRYEGIYSRLFEFCVVSLCSDIELLFKNLFESFSFVGKGDRGFYQRFSEVLETLAKQGLDFKGVSAETTLLQEAFAVRHICIHNFGIVDDGFLKSTNLTLKLGEKLIVDDPMYRRYFVAYVSFLREMDGQLGKFAMTVNEN